MIINPKSIINKNIVSKVAEEQKKVAKELTT
jgi:hypothetical protein